MTAVADRLYGDDRVSSFSTYIGDTAPRFILLFNPQAAEDEVFAKAEAKFEKEEHLVEMLKAGKTTLEIYGFDNLIEKLKAI